MQKINPLTIGVWVYGHYDSRGGTTAIIAETRQQADQHYNKSFGGDDPETRAAWEKWGNPPSEEDFLGFALLELHGLTREEALELCELDSPESGYAVLAPSWTVEDTVPHEALATNKCRLQCIPVTGWDDDGEPINIPPGMAHPCWNDDAFSFCLVLAD